MNHTPLRTLFRQDHEGKFSLKPASSSPPDIETREIVALEPPEFDPDKVVLPREETAIEILKDIRRLLLDAQPNPPADNFRPWTSGPLPTGQGEQSIDIINGYNYLFIPKVPRSVTVYWGNSSMPLAVLTATWAARLKIPYRLDQIRLSWGTGTQGDQIYVYFTTDDISVDIIAYP